MKLFGGRGAVFAALALGALTSYLTWRYVDQTTQAGQKVEMAPVVVANASIPARTIITPDLVRVQALPVQAVHPQATHSLEEVVGKVVRTELAADEPVLSSKLFLQRVQVLAVAQRLEGEDVKPKDQGLTMPGANSQTPQQQMTQRAEPTPQPQAKTATLAVAPEDALKVVLAEEKGKIRLALRRANDSNKPQVALVPMNALLQPEPAQPV